jgi:Domain of unknown function (DUF4167)
MRQQQNNQNRRMRGRGNGGGGNNGGGGGNNNNNNNRRGPNPLTRSYESNGPDVKVRGTAQHVAEKYMSLARDAQSSGDRVMAENYLQHAEHYNRIIAAAQAANAQQFQQAQNEVDEESNVSDHDARFQSNPQPQQDVSQQPFDTESPQPVIEGVPAEVALDEGGAREQRVNGDETQQRENRNRNRRPRGPRPPREDQAGGGDVDALPSFVMQQPPRLPEPAASDD